MRLPPLHSLSRRRRSSHATVYRSLASSADRIAITNATHVRIRRAGRAAGGLASALTALSMVRWTLAIGHAAIHGEVQVTTALCVMRSWSVASTLDDAVRGRDHPWRGAGRDGALCGEVMVA